MDINILLLTIVKAISYIFLLYLVVLFENHVNKNKIYAAGFNLSLFYLFLLIYDDYNLFLITVIPYIIGICVFICGIFYFNGLKPLIAHISTIWKSTNYESLKFKSYLDNLKKVEISFMDKTYPKYPRKLVGWFILIILSFRDILTDLVSIGLYLVVGLYLFALNYISAVVVFIAISHYFFFVIFSSFLVSDPKVKIFIAEFFTITFEAKSKKENYQILKSINQETEIIKMVNQIKTDGVTAEQFKIFVQKFPIAKPYVDHEQCAQNKLKKNEKTKQI